MIKKDGSNLPEDGYYVFGFKNGTVQGMNYSVCEKLDLLGCADWYLKPVSEYPEISDRLIQEEACLYAESFRYCPSVKSWYDSKKDDFIAGFQKALELIENK